MDNNAFVALDVETANADQASICQLGLAHFRDRCLVSEWKSLVDPQDFFDSFNVSIHGITEEMVQGAPTFEQIAPALKAKLTGQFVVSHTHFDRVALARAYEEVELEPPECLWLDSAMVARRTWDDVAERGYGLQPLCERIGYRYQAHDALEDAKAAAMVFLAASAEKNMDLPAWLERLKRPIQPHPSDRIAAEGNPAGPLQGEVLVFTGALSLTRREAAVLAARIGCDVEPGVTRRTTLVVVGNQDARRLHGHEKSSKQRKAEALISEGQQLTILTESDFQVLLRAFWREEPSA